MKTEGCRKWRESLGAYALGQLPPEEQAGLEAHLEGCPECRAEADSLLAVSHLLPHADPERFGPAPLPPAALGRRIEAKIGAERRASHRRRLRFGLALSAATAAAAVALVAFVFSGGTGSSPAQHVEFGALPGGVKIAAKLEPHAFGTEIHMYVKGVRSGTLCRVFLIGANGVRMPAGTFRYRWGEDASAVLSSALDLSRTQAIGVHAGSRTFIAPVGDAGPAATNPNQEDRT